MKIVPKGLTTLPLQSLVILPRALPESDLRRAEKENETSRGRGEKQAAPAISTPEVQSREAGKHFMLRNLGHDAQAQQARQSQQAVQLVHHTRPTMDRSLKMTH